MKKENKEKKSGSKILEFITKNGLGLIAGVLVAGTTTVAAASVIYSSEVIYDNTESRLNATNVSGALDELYTKALTHCPDGYNCVNKTKKCKRATTLHTESCTNVHSSFFCSGLSGYTESGEKGTKVITYGSLGTKGTLKPGDAFDCDVNGDGLYNPLNERFYYVSYKNNGQTINYNIAVLIYYNNVKNGVPDYTGRSVYNTENSASVGPTVAKTHLPTTTQWKNVSLSSTTRDIVGNDGTVYKTGFSYSGYAARLLTYHELYKGCSDGSTSLESDGGLKKCEFLGENSSFSSKDATFQIQYNMGYFLESPRSPTQANYIGTNALDVSYYSLAYEGSWGVRPAIEVNKTYIDY